ncbi:MAG: type II toxin-antitoxin system HicB family antitoxin [Cytophagales bacterium]|jgi:predicted RNase H-like HicB family nuclease|nr:type II toxin-antitoxin system HicB family antitoxin [Cytophagales bacterium]MCA6388472.1 type II toxin-antitoxin system HicB family antitoxin [Cytophagales bacterium]MCA6390897.1 type II toxin-antitoxin system HicB family antitoxin [Cytophagales bacterium]MCA6394878.1 type II toxin-antitoxin system HicB family antitoxin [Cytophagales bacterium]MCA6399085.1 type II toxin-antitoxin system HicB family antitoxin [Cytophagales bacterium]
MKKYLVVFEKTKTGYSAYSPDLIGVVSTGATKPETEKNIYEAIRFHLEGMAIEGLRAPKKTSEAGIYVFN